MSDPSTNADQAVDQLLQAGVSPEVADHLRGSWSRMDGIDLSTARMALPTAEGVARVDAIISGMQSSYADDGRG